MLRKKLIFKFIACSTLIAFVYSSILHEPLFAVTSLVQEQKTAQELKDKLSGFMLPYNYGRVVDSSLCGDSRLIVYIQDLHCNPEAQRNISSIIRLFDEKYGVNRIFVEGAAEGKVDTSLLRAIPTEEMQKKVLDNLINKGLLGGAEYYAVMSKQDKLYGIEKWNTYLSNVDRIKVLIENKERNKALTAALKQRVESLKEKYLSGKIKRIEKYVRNDIAGSRRAEKHYLALQNLGEKVHEDINAYPNLSAYVRMIALNREIRYKRLSGELKEYLAELKTAVPYNVYKVLSEKLNKGERLEEFYFGLSEVSLKYHPQLGHR